MERYDHELALPPLEDVLAELDAGRLEYFEGQENRDGKRYRNVRLLGPEGWTVTGLHRIIAASTLGNWVNREAHVDHINHDPSDNRPENLEIVTSSENHARRRQPLDASKAVDPNRVKKRISRKNLKHQNQQVATQAAIERYLALRNRFTDGSAVAKLETPTWPSNLRPPSKQSLVVASPSAKKSPKVIPDEQEHQRAREAFAAKYAHRRK
ncbi:HNH endonuclease signature motif containing protein [Ascidiaceihabitans sp.]|uniref:HNH endonuclease signature motif containing protein n=1 Tax=Ascidiaceihabitans sp. TaxID=1872644 RepID=UPI003299EC6C